MKIVGIMTINTDALRNVAASAKTANEAILDAMKLLESITVHDDWICVQREAIKEYTLANKKDSQTIHDNANSFYTAIETASQRFDETETTDAGKVNSIDEAIGSVLTVVPMAGMTVAPSVVDFSEIQTSMEGK